MVLDVDPNARRHDPTRLQNAFGDSLAHLLEDSNAMHDAASLCKQTTLKFTQLETAVQPASRLLHRKHKTEDRIRTKIDSKTLLAWMHLALWRLLSTSALSYCSARWRGGEIQPSSLPFLCSSTMDAVVPFTPDTRKVAPAKSAPCSTSALAAKQHKQSRRTIRSDTFKWDELTSDKPIRFSWMLRGLSACAYVWLLTNSLRTGLAISNFDDYTALQPDVYINMGPYAYGVNTFTRQSADLSNVTSTSDNELWSYKYDTTSIAMRAFADFLHVSAFPKPVLYKGTSHPEDLLSASTGFVVLDSLVDAVRDASSPRVVASKLESQDSQHYQNRPQTLLLRVSYEFYDRTHHYLLPHTFNLPIWRTCQALHYTSKLLESVATRSSDGNLTDICSMATQRGWSPLQGVWGMPQFSIALISSLTIISQF